MIGGDLHLDSIAIIGVDVGKEFKRIIVTDEVALFAIHKLIAFVGYVLGFDVSEVSGDKIRSGDIVNFIVFDNRIGPHDAFGQIRDSYFGFAER